MARTARKFRALHLAFEGIDAPVRRNCPVEVPPAQNSFSYGSADQVAGHARSHGQRIRGLALAWHSQQPGWAQNLSGSALRSAMVNHVTQVAGHYRGQIYAWDVVNEAFADGGSGRPHGVRG